MQIATYQMINVQYFIIKHMLLQYVWMFFIRAPRFFEQPLRYLWRFHLGRYCYDTTVARIYCTARAHCHVGRVGCLANSCSSNKHTQSLTWKISLYIVQGRTDRFINRRITYQPAVCVARHLTWPLLCCDHASNKLISIF